MIGGWHPSSSTFWKLYGAPTPWISLLRATMPRVRSYIMFIGAVVRRGQMLSASPRPGRSVGSMRLTCPLVGVWRALREQQAVAIVLVHSWESSTWWHLVASDGRYRSKFVVDWIWLSRCNPNLFIEGTAPGRMVLPPIWLILAIWVNFSPREGRKGPVLS